MPLFLLATLLAVNLVLGSQITDKTDSFGKDNSSSTPKVEDVISWLDQDKPLENPTTSPTPNPGKQPSTIPVQESDNSNENDVDEEIENDTETEKVTAYNNRSEKEMPTNLPQKAIDNSPALDNWPTVTPTPTNTPEITPTSTPVPTGTPEPRHTPPPCGPDFENGKPLGTMPCIF